MADQPPAYVPAEPEQARAPRDAGDHEPGTGRHRGSHWHRHLGRSHIHTHEHYGGPVMAEHLAVRDHDGHKTPRPHRGGGDLADANMTRESHMDDSTLGLTISDGRVGPATTCARRSWSWPSTRRRWRPRSSRTARRCWT